MYYGEERYTYRKQNNTWKMTNEETSRNCRLLHSSQVRALSMKRKKKIWTDTLESKVSSYRGTICKLLHIYLIDPNNAFRISCPINNRF